MSSRDKVLSYCQYCSNRKFAPDKGVICSLTGEKPAFENRCPDFEKDTQLVIKRGSRHTHSNHYTTGLWEKIKDLIHPNYDPDELDDVTIHLSKIKFMLLFCTVLSGWVFSLYVLIVNQGDNTIEVLNLLAMTSLIIVVLLMGEVKKTFSSTPLIHISPDGLKLYGEHNDWSDVVSFIIIEEPSPSHIRVVDSYLQFEFIGHNEDTRIMIEKLNISKHDLVNVLASVQKRFMNPDEKATVS